MAYQTGSSTGITDLLDKLKLFLEANGWTTNSYITEGSGKRLHTKIGTDTFVNLRALANETFVEDTFNTNSRAQYSLLGNLSTGYDGTARWQDQPGARFNGSTQYLVGGVRDITGSIPTYHFFSCNSAVYVWVEWTAGQYQAFGFGKLDQIGAYTGGQFFFGCATGKEGAGQAIPAAANLFGVSNGGNNAYGVIYAQVDGDTRMRSAMGTLTLPTDHARVFDSFTVSPGLAYMTPNAINSLAVLLPVRAFVFRDTSNVFGTSRFSPIGYLPFLYAVNIRSLTPGQTFTLGSDNYIVLPLVQKSGANLGTTSTSGYLGVAIKTN